MMEIKLSYEAFKRSSRFGRACALAEKAGLPPKQVFILIVQALDQSFGGMEPSVKYKTEDLFEPSAWVDMGDAIRRSLGICLSYLAANDLIPLLYANRLGANNKLYMLKPGVIPAACSFRVC
jgi:hypothetical protein